jgi:MFS family permease
MEFFIFYVVFLIVSGILANRYNRSVIGYVVLSLIISPLLTWIILLALGPNKSNVNTNVATNQ